MGLQGSIRPSLVHRGRAGSETPNNSRRREDRYLDMLDRNRRNRCRSLTELLEPAREPAHDGTELLERCDRRTGFICKCIHARQRPLPVRQQDLDLPDRPFEAPQQRHGAERDRKDGDGDEICANPISGCP